MNDKKKIICLVGKSCTGKDTAVILLQELISKYKMSNNTFLQKIASKGFKKAISYTTRPKRENEIDGVDYHFVSVEEFEKIRKDIGFVEETSYKVNGEIWYYGFAKNEFDENETYIMIANPRGLKAFLESDFKNIIEPIVLECSDEARKQRYFQRDSSNYNLDKQWKARIKQDKKDFKKIFKLLVKFQTFSMINTEKLSKEEVAQYIIGLL